ncbi:MAG: hypothetical protein GY821_04110, partial [Gammaproteobacteria bacterium]|nr:hypothetical protein [Gammaproteobacteria bacterium]
MPTGLKMPQENEARLRELQFAAPRKLEGEHAIFLVLVAMHGHPIVFRLSDFVEETNGQYSRFEMRFPVELKNILDTCDLIVWGWEEQLMLLNASYQNDPNWTYTKAGSTLKRTVAEDWTTLDVAVINRFSEFGKIPTTTVKEFYDTRKNRDLLCVLEKLVNDPGYVKGHVNRAVHRVGGLEHHLSVAAGFVGPGMLRSDLNNPENDIITVMVMRAQGIWYYLIAEILYHPHWLATQYQPAKDPLQARGRMRSLINFVRDKLKQVRMRIDKVTNPYRETPHQFITLMKAAGGDILGTLEPYVLDMEVTMIIDCFFTMPGTTMPRGFFDQWLWNHARRRRGCESHMDLIRNLLQQQASLRGNGWRYAQVQQALQTFVDWYITIAVARLYEDVYTLCYFITKGYIWPPMRTRAMYIRERMDIHYP